MKKYFVIAIMICAASSQAFAKPRRSYVPSTSYNSYAYTNRIDYGNDQQRCEAEANYMAQNRITGHVWGCIGNFEGVGFGFSPNCNTCTPGNHMTLTGDASAMDSSGRWYRVRSWR